MAQVCVQRKSRSKERPRPGAPAQLWGQVAGRGSLLSFPNPKPEGQPESGPKDSSLQKTWCQRNLRTPDLDHLSSSHSEVQVSTFDVLIWTSAQFFKLVRNHPSGRGTSEPSGRFGGLEPGPHTGLPGLTGSGVADHQTVK